MATKLNRPRARTKRPTSARAAALRTGTPARRRLARTPKSLALAARSFAAKVDAFELRSSVDADLAGRWRQEIDAQERKVIDWFAPAKQAAFHAHAAICRQENEALAPYRQARRIINVKLAAWRTAQSKDAAARGPDTSDTSQDKAARVEGVNFREQWRAEVTDKIALVRAIAARSELINLVEPNMAALNHLARAHKGALEIPGVHIWRELTVAASARA